MSSPLIEQLQSRYGYTVLDANNLEAFLRSSETKVLFFTGDPHRYPESNDVAVILPELCKAFPGGFFPAVVSRALEDELKQRYDVNVWPSLVFLRGSAFLGKINRIRDWSDYMAEIPSILNSAPRTDPGTGIPFVAEASRQTDA